MARDDVDIRVRLAQARKAAADAKRVAGGVAGIGTAAEKSERQARGLHSTTRRLGAGLGRAGFGVAAGGATALAGGLYGAARAGAFAVKSAVDLGEQTSKSQVVFREGAKEVTAFADTTAQGIGISRRAALEATGVFGNMLVPMGVARKDAAGMSTRMVTLAGDLASFNNADPSETLDALRAGLAGETEPLQRFGVFLNAARVEQEALALGLKQGTKPPTRPPRPRRPTASSSGTPRTHRATTPAPAAASPTGSGHSRRSGRTWRAASAAGPA